MKHIERVKKPKVLKFDMNSEFASSNEDVYRKTSISQMTASQQRQYMIRSNWAAATNVRKFYEETLILKKILFFLILF